MTVTYEVGGSTSSGRLDIDFYVSRPLSSERHFTSIGMERLCLFSRDYDSRWTLKTNRGIGERT